MNCNDLFMPGTLTTVMDGGAGSSGKGKLTSYIAENNDMATFVCNTFAPQAGHWVKLRNGKSYFYQTLNSCAYMMDKVEKMYLGPGATIELPALLREIAENKVPKDKLGISPIIPILTEIDAEFEKGNLGFDGASLTDKHEGTMKTGTTAHGCGSVAARRVLRSPSLKLARDIPELQDYLCDVPNEIMARLANQECGILEIAQGFQLSNQHSRFFPYVTSRNVTVAQGLSDMFLPIRAAGPVVINFRTFPIRISSNKYICQSTGKHLTWAEVEAGIPHKVYEGNSGSWYPDQTELTWGAVTDYAESPNPIIEMTSVTKLPRRVATFSKINVEEAIKFNDTGMGVHISVNFMNYVDHKMTGVTEYDQLTDKTKEWLLVNLREYAPLVRFLGTGALTDEMVFIPEMEIV